MLNKLMFLNHPSSLVTTASLSPSLLQATLPPSTWQTAATSPVATLHTFSSVLQEIPNTFTKAVATKTFCPLSGRLAARHRALATAITSATEVFRGEVRADIGGGHLG